MIPNVLSVCFALSAGLFAWNFYGVSLGQDGDVRFMVAGLMLAIIFYAAIYYFNRQAKSN
jgi:hypothetical protein